MTSKLLKDHYVTLVLSKTGEELWWSHLFQRPELQEVSAECSETTVVMKEPLSSLRLS